jgi:hypothetical protein
MRRTDAWRGPRGGDPATVETQLLTIVNLPKYLRHVRVSLPQLPIPNSSAFAPRRPGALQRDLAEACDAFSASDG